MFTSELNIWVSMTPLWIRAKFKMLAIVNAPLSVFLFMKIFYSNMDLEKKRLFLYHWDLIMRAIYGKNETQKTKGHFSFWLATISLSKESH